MIDSKDREEISQNHAKIHCKTVGLVSHLAFVIIVYVNASVKRFPP